MATASLHLSASTVSDTEHTTSPKQGPQPQTKATPLYQVYEFCGLLVQVLVLQHSPLGLSKDVYSSP